MKRIVSILISALVFWPGAAHAAERFFQGYRFETSVIPSTSYPWNFSESLVNGQNSIFISEGQEYAIVVRNPLPVRVAVAVTVDGLNTIDGKRTNPADGQKWIIEPYSSITVDGWQTSDSSLRKFVFTRANSSYANWKELRDRQNYTANLGIIGVAYFWSSAELLATLNPPRPYALDEMSPGSALGSGEAKKSMAPEIYREKERAGTGMGRREWNQVRRVNFYYDTGMYAPSDALTIRYEFGRNFPEPQPFAPDYRYQQNYAPEMPR